MSHHYHTNTFTYLLCANCRSKLSYKRETVSEPAHYACNSCGARWLLDGKEWSSVIIPRPRRAPEVQQCDEQHGCRLDAGHVGPHH